jgi:hypothetical protein
VQSRPGAGTHVRLQLRLRPAPLSPAIIGARP